MSDLIRETRRVVLPALKADAALTDLVSAASIYPSTVPSDHTWPFIRWDAPNSIPRGRGCTDGADLTFMLHCFAKPRMSGTQVLETAEDHASRILTAMHNVIHRNRLPIATGTVRLTVRSSRLIRDGDEASAYHGLLNCFAKAFTG
jgi:hypothetical protein